MMVKSTILIIILSFSSLGQQQEQLVDYYVNLIEDTIRHAEASEWATNADRYRPTNEEEPPRDYGTFDFVIIGCGAAGSVLANRLTEIQSFNVLVLEAGSLPNNISAVSDLYLPIEFTDFNWGFVTVPQTTACQGMINNTCPLARGRGVGGSTLLDGTVYSRGPSRDYNRWAEHVGDERWSYDNILPYFRKSEDLNVQYADEAPLDLSYHGRGGYLHVDFHRPKTPYVQAFLEANVEIGYEVLDSNGVHTIGAGQTQVNTKNGRRQDDGTAFILPILNRTNLHLLTHSYVTKININDKTNTAESVEFTHRNVKYIVRAKRETILSAGAIQSPQILMLSGVGPRDHLEKFGIKVIQDLEVGSTLRDHSTFFGINFGSNVSARHLPIREAVEEFLNGEGFLASSGNLDALGFYPSRYSREENIPDIELLFASANQFNSVLAQRAFLFTDETFQTVWNRYNVLETFIIYVICLHSVSVGTVRLQSSSPYDYPLIDSKFLSDENDHDINVLYDGVQILMELSKTEAFKRINATIQGGPLPSCKEHRYLSAEYWYCALRVPSSDVYHPVSTCPMARSPEEGVVNSECQVFGIKKLRVIDASIFPFTIAGHPNAPTVMVAEVMADVIKQTYNAS